MPVLWISDFELDKLSPVPEALLMAMGAIGQPSARGHLALTLVRSRLAPQAEPWIRNPAAMGPILERLRESGLAQEVHKGFWTLTAAAREPVCRRAHRKGHLKPLSAAGQSVYGSGQVVLDPLGRDLAVLRLAFLEERTQDWLAAHERLRQTHGPALRQRDPLALLCGQPFDPAWFEGLSPVLQSHAAWALLHDQAIHNQPNEAFRAWLEARSRNATSPLGPLLEYLVLEGRLPEARKLLERLKPAQRSTVPVLLLEAVLCLAEGRAEEATLTFRSVLDGLGKGPRRKAVHLPGLMDIFCILAYIGCGTEEALQDAALRLDLLERRPSTDPLACMHAPLQRMLLLAQGHAQREDPPPPKALAGLARFLGLLVDYLGGGRIPRESLEEVDRALAGLPLGLFREETRELERRVQGGLSRDPFPFLDLVPHSESWEKALEALQGLVKARAPQRPSRLAWWVSCDPADPASMTLEPREQRLDARGQWTRGKSVALKRLKEEGRSLGYLLPQDLAVIDGIREGWKGCELPPRQALKALVGHPQVHWSEDSGEEAVHVEVVAGRPDLRMSRRGQILELRLDPPLSGEEVMVRPDGPCRIIVIALTAAHRRLEEILGPGLEVPAHAEALVLKALGSVAPIVTVHSIEAIGAEAARKAGLARKAGDPRIHLLLMPFHQGLKVQIRVRPLEGGGYLLPGAEGAHLLVEQGGGLCLVVRNLGAETAAAQALLEALPSLPPEEGRTAWVLEDPEACMDLLLDLEEARHLATVLWPEGGRIETPKTLGLESLRLSVKSHGAWFEAEGSADLGEGRIVDLPELLQSKAGSGRFLKLEDGRFVALTEAFRRRLEDLRALGTEGARGLRLHALSSLALEGLESEVGSFQGLDAWRALASRLKEALETVPALPEGFQASLRPYQMEGFQWMMRLSAAGLGACLADDMGLGKTIQTLAVLLARAHQGPSLVVAPTSVCANWALEAKRFAPGLQVQVFGEGDREAALQDAGPGDLLVCSYGLLSQETSKLQSRPWGTLVLDEGQAIKNASTRRSQAVMELEAGFRILLSGTPVENHLAEFWNIFQFLNPGLLGTLDQFRHRFQDPVERDQDMAALGRLRRIVSPFLLRRTKGEVLKELPPRTEITLELDPLEKEGPFLEALRRQSLQELENGPRQALHVLAALMRLRRACCNSRLVLDTDDIPSAKLEAFLELVDELRENGHRALVFSQFTDHLAILRKALDERGIRYQYLDGSTPARSRAAAVKAFQAGEGELFLISLRAGGMGLNLTAADYVLHMDPWWNPAVEDQASDRTHRIGQTRPVTVYRLVLKGTVEQKILALHQRKRQLADDLLSESAQAATLDTETLMSLLRD